MIRLLVAASIYTRDFLRRYMPSNVLLDRIHARRGLKWGLPAMLLALPYTSEPPTGARPPLPPAAPAG